MRRVQQANQRPFRCAVIPFMANSNASGFIDTGQFLGDEKVYVSFEGAVEIAKEIGWVGPSVSRGMEAENARLQAELDQAKAELADAQHYIDSVEYVARGPMKAYKKPGRKPKEPEPAKAA